MKMQALYATALALAALTAAAASDTWHLDPQTGWQNVAEMPEGQYLLAIAQLRRQLAGDSKDALAALETLRREYPDLVGGDLDAFVAAEEVYVARRFGKAAKLYRDFLDTWPDSALQPAAMERYFSIGSAFLQGQKRRFLGIFRLPAFDEGVVIMRNISDRAGNTPIALRALQVTADNQERRKRFVEAYHTWAEISSRWPTGPEGRDALLRMARALHASYNGPDYDVSFLRSAKVYFEDYTLRYPQIADEMNLAETLVQIDEQLAHKYYEVGRYYERASNMDAAHAYYRQVIDAWPATAAARMSAAQLGPEARPAFRQTIRRTAFDKTTGFLDNWFGAQWIFGSKNEVE